MDHEVLEFVNTLVAEGERTPEGIRLPTERRLSEITGLSRSQIRERLAGLQFLGMLRKVHGSGNLLVPPSIGTASNIFEVWLRAEFMSVEKVAETRELLEIAVAPRVVDTITDTSISRLENLVYQMVDATAARDITGGLRADFEFHMTLFAALNNPLIAYLMNGIRQALWSELLERRRSTIALEIKANGGVAPDTFRNDTVHFEITRALRKRNKEAVSTAMTEHFDNIRRLQRSTRARTLEPQETTV